MTAPSPRGPRPSATLRGVLALALERLGHRDWSLYDGSWTEWGSFPDLKIATGEP